MSAERSYASWNRRRMSRLAQNAGLDTSRCEFCNEILEGSESRGLPWRRGLDGMGAHERCIRIHVR